MNTKPSKADRKRADKLRQRLNELADAQQSSLAEMDEIQAELAQLGDDAHEAPDADPTTNLRADLDQLKASLDESEERYRRVLADFSNYQRRATENERRAKEAGKAGVLEQMVAVLDTFDLAARMNPETTTPQAMLQGVQMIKGEMLRLLATQGFAVLEPARGEEFDPHRHEAVAQTDADDVQPGAIVDVMQTGYALNDRVLRPAKVVLRPSPDTAQAESEDPATADAPAETDPPNPPHTPAPPHTEDSASDANSNDADSRSATPENAATDDQRNT